MISARQMYRVCQIGVVTYSINGLLSGNSDFSALTTALALYEATMPDCNDELMVLIHLCSVHDSTTILSRATHIAATLYRADHIAANAVRGLSNTASRLSGNLFSWWRGNAPEGEVEADDLVHEQVHTLN